MVASIASGIAGLAGLNAPGESWRDRLKEAAYNSPSGTRIAFAYKALSREFDKRTTEFAFAGVNNSYVQENGYSSRRYPMQCIFSGADCDRFATAFEAMLLETGVGQLEHPLYGTIDVIPFGTVTRRDDPVSEGNQSVVEVTFWTTTGAIYPQSQSHPQSEIEAALVGFDLAAATAFANAVSLNDQLEKASAKATIRSFLRDVSATLEGISDKVTSINNAFRDAQATVNMGLDVMIGQPLQLMLQITNLIRAPARAAEGIMDRLDAYLSLGFSIMTSLAGSPDLTLAAGSSLDGRTSRLANDFHIADAFASAAVASSVSALVVNPVSNDGEQTGKPFRSRQDALAAAEAMLDQFDALVRWRDGAFRSLGGLSKLGAYQVDTGEAYRALQSAVALCTGYLIAVSFSLANERTVEIEQESTIINMAAQLYGTVDERLDFLIDTNDLTGSEILELPRGRRLVYYPP